MTRESTRPAALEWRVFRGSTAVEAGLLSENGLRTKGWIRVRHNVYADSRLERDHALACRATLIRLPGDAAVLAGPSAAYVHGIHDAAGPDDPVHVILLRERRAGSQSGTRLHRCRLDASDVQGGQLVGDGTVGGEVPVTTPARTAWDVAVWLPLSEAVAIVDALLFRKAVTPAELSEITERLAARPGGRRAAHALALCDAHAETRAESLLRVRLFQAGLPLATARHPVGLGNPPLSWPDHRVALWCDLRRADPIDQLRDEAAMLRGLVDRSWTVLQAGARRLELDFPDVVREIRGALRANGWRARYRR